MYYGKCIYYGYRYWKIVNYDDTTDTYICRAINSQDIRYLGKEIVEKCLTNPQ